MNTLDRNLRRKNSAVTKTLYLLAICFCSLFFNSAFAQGAKLFSYQDSSQARLLSADENSRLARIKSHKSTGAVSLVKVESAALNNNILQLPLPDGTVMTLVNTQRETPLPGVSTWAGRSRDNTSWGVFSISNGVVSGSFSSLAQRYSLEAYGKDANVLVKVDKTQLGPAHEPASPPQPGQAEKKSLAAPNSVSTRSDASTIKAVSATPVVIDLLIAYTPNARLTMGNPAGVVGEAITSLNEALRNSLDAPASVSVRAVDFFEIPLADAGVTMTNMVRVFSASEIVESRRKISGADVMMLLTGDVNGICGEASDIGPNVYHAYAVANAICVMRDTVFQHEFAHLLGAHHEIARDPSGPSYAHGFVLQNALGTNQCWKSIVTDGKNTNCLGGDTNFFSNPRINMYLKDHPEVPPIKIGSSTANNARIIAENASIVAAFNAVRSQGEAQVVVGGLMQIFFNNY